jgi:hypothetical protein
MAALPRSTCKGCGKPIVWALNPKSGKCVPIDASPVVYRVYQTQNGQVECLPEHPGEDTFGVNHFTTCTKANDFHKR